MVCILDCSRYDHWRRQIQIRAVIWRGSRCRPARHRETFPFPQPKPPRPHLSPRITHPVKRKNWSAEDERRESRAPAAHILYLDNTDQTRTHSGLRLSRCLLYCLMWNVRHAEARRRRARQTGNPGLQRRHVISMDVLFLLNRLSCEM